MLGFNDVDVDDIATALADQTDYDHCWLINPETGEVVFWTSDTGIDGQNPVDIDELDLVMIEPLPPYVWYQDMVDFAGGLSDHDTGRRLSASLQGMGAFRRFKGQVYDRHPQLISHWHAFRDARAHRRAIEWLEDQNLSDASTTQRLLNENPEPDLPLRSTSRSSACLHVRASYHRQSLIGQPV